MQSDMQYLLLNSFNSPVWIMDWIVSGIINVGWVDCKRFGLSFRKWNHDQLCR